MPDLVPPMQVAAGTGQAPVGPDWVVELAWTGHRCIAYVEPGGRTRLLSSGNVSMTPAYPELLPELERRSPPGGMILDGTLVARGEEHAPRVARLQRRSARYRPTERQIRRVPVDLQVADLLWLDGHSLVDVPYRDRRNLLEGPVGEGHDQVVGVGGGREPVGERHGASIVPGRCGRVNSRVVRRLP